MTTDIIPQKRRYIPKGGDDDPDRTTEERLVRQTGQYLERSSTLCAKFSIHRDPSIKIQSSDAPETFKFNRL